jgi:hypothetical protein
MCHIDKNEYPSAQNTGLEYIAGATIYQNN